MTSTLKGIRALLATKIADLDDGDSSLLLAAVYEYARDPAGAYPCAIILPTKGSKGVQKDTHRIERTFSFEVSVYQEQGDAGKTREEANETLTDVTDAIIAAFDQDPTLGNEVARVKIIQMAFNFQAQAGAHLVSTFTIECDVLVPNYASS